MLYDLSLQQILIIKKAMRSAYVREADYQHVLLALDAPLPFAPLFPIKTMTIPRSDPDDEIESLTVTTVDNETLFTFQRDEEQIEFVLPTGYYIAKTKDGLPR